MQKENRKTKPTPPALRLVSTKDMSRDDWLDVRKKGIGASDSAAAIGLNPYQSQLELWMIKTGRDAHMPKVNPNDESSPMYWGNILEPIVAEHYSKRTGNKVRRVNAVLQHPDSDKAWMLANLDYAVSANDDVQILECKTAGEWGAKLWRNGVPEYVQCQVQHQLAVTGKKAADVCVLLCGQKIEIYRIDRDEEVIDRIIDLERQFWHYVETDTPPPVDGSDSSEKAIRYLYPEDTGATVYFSDEQPMNDTFDELIAARDEVKLLKQYESRLKQKVQEAMCDHSKAKFANGQVSWKRSKDSTSLDVDSLLMDQPELMTQYSKTKPGSRRFSIQT